MNIGKNCEIVADENGWAILVDGVLHSTHASYGLALDAMAKRKEPIKPAEEAIRLATTVTDNRQRRARTAILHAVKPASHVETKAS